MQTLVIYAIIGAICMLIVTGGVLSMATEADPSTGSLVAGAVGGGLIGSAVSMFGTEKGNDLTTKIMTAIGGGAEKDELQMNVGYPTF